MTKVPSASAIPVDIIPDIHGQAEKLEALLRRLGWRRTPSGWANDTSAREIVFLGDFIDRGPENARVLHTVRSLVDAGKAHAVMGNHELNAIHFHTPHPARPGAWLRAHTPERVRQHAAFLKEFPLGAPATAEAIAFMAGLPLFLERPGFRAVHACWDEAAIAALRVAAPTGILSEAQLMRAADPADPLFGLVETTTKGPEAVLPAGAGFRDKDGHDRRAVRIKWWVREVRCWADLALSVPDPERLPDAPPPAAVLPAPYPAAAPPVFFGHFWMTGAPVLQAPNVLCLDYSAGIGAAPLLAYRLEDPKAPLCLSRLVASHGPVPVNGRAVA
jgi:hypothetical protein